MPSVVENQQRWTEYPWEREGHEWSPGGTAMGGDMFWWRGLLPRVHAHLPAGCILEIGPGFGRWTSHLAGYAHRLVVIDVTERCIEHCRRRFAECTHLEYWTNDGQSLDMIADASLDFVFSFDSLVHAEATVVRSYLMQLARKLKPGGTGFIHHSNLGAFAGIDGLIPSWVARKNWRAETMSAHLFRNYCREAGLTCVTQEVINWVSRSRKADRHRISGPGMPMTDAMSTFVRPRESVTDPTRVYVNPWFVHEWRQCAELADAYRRDALIGSSESHEVRGEGAHQTRSVRHPLWALIKRARERGAAATDDAISLARDRFTARQVRRREPIMNSLLRRRCPDCRKTLTSTNRCTLCNVDFKFPTPN